MPRIGLPAYCSVDAFGPIFAVVDLDEKRLDYLLGKIEKFKRLQEVDPDLFKVVYFEYMPTWYDMSELGVDDEFEEPGWSDAQRIEVIGDEEFPESTICRTECDRLMLSKVPGGTGPIELYWEAIIKHTDARITTESLTEDFLAGLRANN